MRKLPLILPILILFLATLPACSNPTTALANIPYTYEFITIYPSTGFTSVTVGIGDTLQGYFSLTAPSRIWFSIREPSGTTIYGPEPVIDTHEFSLLCTESGNYRLQFTNLIEDSWGVGARLYYRHGPP